MTASVLYDEIGVGYRRYRRPDPRLQTAIQDALGDSVTVVNVGAGTGSYEPPDRRVVAVELSQHMISERAHGAAPCVCADATVLPFADGRFDAAMAIFSVHHWREQVRGLREMSRVASTVVVLTFDPRVHNEFWLFRDYFPDALTLASNHPIPVEAAAAVLGARVVRIPVPHDCCDGFAWAYWRRPDAYLDPEVRRCMSALAQLPSDKEEAGVARLRADLASGRWHERHGYLERLSEVDAGFRLLVTDRARS